MDDEAHNHIDKIFKDALDFHRDAPGAEVWSRIEKDLEKEDRKRILLRRYRSIGMAAVLLVFLILSGIFSNLMLHRPSPLIPELARTRSPQFSQSRPSVSPLYQKFASSKKTASSNIKITAGNHHQQIVDPGFNPAAQYIVPTENPQIEIQKSKYPMTSLPSLIKSGSEERGVAIQANKIISPKGSLARMIVKPVSQKFKNRLSITPYFSQEFAGYNLADNDATGPDGQEIEQRERNVFSASVGIYLNYRLKKRWMIQSGISYSWSGSNIDSATSYAVKDNRGQIQFKLNTISGYGYLSPNAASPPNVGDSIYTSKAYSELNYITVPLIISYTFPLNRFLLTIGSGATFNFLTSATVSAKTYGSNYPGDECSVNMMGLKKINLGILIKADLEYRLSRNIGIDLIPSFKNTLSPINLQTAISAYPYNFGLGLGMTYHF